MRIYTLCINRSDDYTRLPVPLQIMTLTCREQPDYIACAEEMVPTARPLFSICLWVRKKRVWFGSNTHTCSEDPTSGRGRIVIQCYLTATWALYLKSYALETYMRTRFLIAFLACSTLNDGNNFLMIMSIADLVYKLPIQIYNMLNFNAHMRL